jgi:predicted pyridoxine 5'-phosphate oxidase superfamily flavin-nucleotide-binding protein
LFKSKNQGSSLLFVLMARLIYHQKAQQRFGMTNTWFFADIHSPHTIENLLINASIALNVVDVFIRKGYRFKGIGKVLSEGPLFEEVISFYRKAGAQYSIKNIVLVKVERILPVVSPVYDTDISEEEVKKKWTDYWSTI